MTHETEYPINLHGVAIVIATEVVRKHLTSAYMLKWYLTETSFCEVQEDWLEGRSLTPELSRERVKFVIAQKALMNKAIALAQQEFADGTV